MEAFELPRYEDLPDSGLYLDQTVRYINEKLAPLEVGLTQSMVSNYVKLGYLRHPEQKLYRRDQLACLLFITLAKQVLPMEKLGKLFRLQQQTYDLPTAYAFFRTELKRGLEAVFANRELTILANTPETFAKRALRSVVIAVSHMIYLSSCFSQLEEGRTWND